MAIIPSLKAYVDRKLAEQSGSGGAGIDDITPSTTSTFSSSKVNSLVNAREPQMYKSSEEPMGVIPDGSFWVNTSTSPYVWSFRWGGSWNPMKTAEVFTTTTMGLDDLIDVELFGGLVDGNVLTWEQSSNLFKPKAPSGGGGGATNLNGLSDVDLTVAPTNDQILTYESASSQWKAKTPASPTVTKTNQIVTLTANQEDKTTFSLKGKIFTALILKQAAGVLPNIATDSTKAMETSHNGTYVAANAFDGSTASYWASGQGGANVVNDRLVYDFVTPQEIHWLRLYQSATLAYRSTDVIIEACDDWDDVAKTGTWQEAYRWQGMVNTADNNTNFEHNLGAKRYWSIRSMVGLGSTYNWRVGQVEYSLGNAAYDIFRPLKESDNISIEFDETGTINQTRVKNNNATSKTIKISYI